MKPDMPVEPYRIFFSVGIISGLWGVGQWALLELGVITNYPAISHPSLMVEGFLFAFVIGFLMTAVPRFTGSFQASTWEIILALILAGTEFFVNSAMLFNPGLKVVSLILFVMQSIALCAFCVRRFVCRKHTPPAPFLFIGVGLASSLLGPVFLLVEYIDPGFSEAVWLPAGTVTALGKLILYHGMILSLVIGVGGRLIPALLGHSALPIAPVVNTKDHVQQAKSQLTEIIVLAFLFVASFLLEVIILPTWGRALRSLIVTYCALQYWKIQLPSKAPGSLSVWLRVFGFCLLLGLWSYTFFPAYSQHLAHITFIAGFTLLVLLIATRVTISHGGYNMEIERRSHVLWWTGSLLIIAALTRSTAFLLGKSYFVHIAYSAYVWLAGLLLWSIFFVPKMVIRSRRKSDGL